MLPKVYTCTLNLAIDLFIETDSLKPFVVNRTNDDEIQANGKGVNVSLVLDMLGIENTALGFRAGFTGRYIEEFLKEKQIKSNFIEVPGFTRINVFTQVNDVKEEYKLVNKGPEISGDSINNLSKQIKTLQAGDYLCISGSLSQGIEPSILVDIAKICYNQKISLILDSSYPEVLECLKYKPYLVKPNEEELGSWFDVTIKSKEDYLYYGKKLLDLGAQNVLLSVGKEGAYFFNKEKVLYGNSPKGEVVNTACAGDTLLGTFLEGLIRTQPLPLILRKAIAAGSSTAFRKGLTDFSDVKNLQKQVYITEQNI